MKLERTRDMKKVAAILSHPAIFRHVGDDSVLSCEPIDHDAFFWMLVTEGEPIGVFLVHAHNSACYEMHTSILPQAWGEKAAIAAQMLLDWAFNGTPCKKMITAVPAYNRAALRFAKAGGMKQEGINRKSFLHDGELIDQIMLGITKKEWLCQQ